MPDLLIHSMAEFSDIIFPALEIAQAKNLVEVGAEYGTMTLNLIEFTKQKGGELVSIDPCPSPEAEELFHSTEHARLVVDLSLNVLDRYDADAYLIDGDHNYYTVFHELELSWKKSRGAGRPYLAFLHDVGWPCARRDQYCNPDQIPEEYRHAHSWDKGITLDNPDLIDGGFRGEGGWAAALKEGGPQNGVLTAIEDFAQDKDEQLFWARIPAVFGLGVLFDRNAPWTEEMVALLGPLNDHPLLATLERNRLQCYLRVIEMQDAMSEQNEV